MIISRTPFRISFAGGGTDIGDFYRQCGGAVTSTAINKYMYIAVNRKFDGSIRVSYSKTENVNNVDDIQHPNVREALKYTGITKGIEITSIADIPAQTGLGSSSSFTVGLLNALYAYKGEFKPQKVLAEEAAHIEINLCKAPIGKQDQYIAAYGGLQHIQFNKDDTVFVDPVLCKPSVRKSVEEGIMLFYTNVTRPSSSILTEQKNKINDKLDILKNMRDQSIVLRDAIINGDIDLFGATLHNGWMLKKQLVGGISNNEFDTYYDRAINAGALGGKILGAGGGGFLMLYCPMEKQDNVRRALYGLKETTVGLEPQGSKIIYIGD